MEYPYVFPNYLKNPPTYQFSKFGGNEFLKEYKKNRKYAIDNLSKVIKKPYLDFDDYLNKLNSFKFDYSIILRNNSELTKEIMQAILLFQRYGNDRKKAYELLSKFIKKFEVFKKIYTRYNLKDMKKDSEDFSNISNYVLLSLNLILYYKKENNLKFLNACLKLNDLSISSFDSLIEEDEKKAMLLSINEEVEIIKHLFIKNGVLI